MKTAFYDMSDIQSGLIPDGINLSGKPAGGSYEAARLCETIKVSVEDISPTPRGEIFTIPVRFVAEPSMEAPIWFLEEVVDSGTATKAEFRYLRKLCKLFTA